MTTSYPNLTSKEYEAECRVFMSNNVNYWTYIAISDFEKEFAVQSDTAYAFP